MPLKTVPSPDLMRTIAGLLGGLLVFTGLVPEDASEAVKDAINQIGTFGVGLVSSALFLYSLIRKPKA